MNKCILLTFLLLYMLPASAQSYGEFIQIDSTWRYTATDTSESLGDVWITYYDSLMAPNSHFDHFYAGRDIYNEKGQLRDKHRVFHSGFAYRIEFNNGTPSTAGYSNELNSIYIVWNEDGRMKSLTRYYLGDEDYEKVIYDGLSIWFDDHGAIEGYELYDKGVLIMKKR